MKISHSHTKLIKNTIKGSFLFLIVLTLTSTKSIAQNCNHEINELDHETGLWIKRTEDMSLGKLNNQPLYAKSQSIGDKKYLKIRYYCYDDFFIDDKSPVILTFSDNTKLQITPRPSANIEQERTNLTKISELLTYNISSEQYNTITTQQIKRITFQTWDNSFVDVELRERFRSVLQQLLKCLD